MSTNAQITDSDRPYCTTAVTETPESVMSPPVGGRAMGHSVPSGVGQEAVRLHTINIQPQALLTDSHTLLLAAATHHL